MRAMKWRSGGWRVTVAALCLTLAACAASLDGGPVDLLIIGGRVMDPETGLDAVRNVALRDGVIVAVTEETPDARERLDATGLVVAPGFIDLHAHGQDLESSRFQARDGVTTAMELEIGVYPVDAWYGTREGRALIHFGASVSHQGARREAFGAMIAQRTGEGTFSLGRGGASDAYLYDAASDDELRRLARLMGRGLDQGGLGFGFGISYTPGASHEELYRLFAGAAARQVPVYIHLRSAGAFQAGGAIAPFQEVVANAAGTGASVHIVHLNSSAGEAARSALELIRGAQARGVDVTTEAYPYTASASRIESALFDGWDGRSPEAYARLQWVDTGERLTAETFRTYRAQGGWVITHGRSEDTNEWIVSQPDVIAASDGIPFSEGRAHPRGAGTFARTLGHYVRERGVLSLMDGLRKMTLMPAQRLERVTDQMSAKGRVQVGADADLTLFDPDRVIDRATYDAPDRYSEGILHVLVAGTFVVRDEALVDGVTPGQAIRGRTP
jgi:N-acyl-D-aspartate/D-glutamate deacylase